MAVIVSSGNINLNQANGFMSVMLRAVLIRLRLNGSFQKLFGMRTEIQLIF